MELIEDVLITHYYRLRHFLYLVNYFSRSYIIFYSCIVETLILKIFNPLHLHFYPIPSLMTFFTDCCMVNTGVLGLSLYVII